MNELPAANELSAANALPTRYEPQTTETEIYQKWMEANCFAAAPDTRTPYAITVPPPNITGVLHLGHALNHTLMDTLGRWKRMSGFNTLILPGVDHGGISTQSVVEKMLGKTERLTRHDLGREGFVARVETWASEYGSTILSQLKALGCGYDWSRTRYTLDEAYSEAVLTTFEKLYQAGYIYRGKRMVNWCPFHHTAISDIEVENTDEDGFLYHIRYFFAGEPESSVTVATTRPETLLGDTAVAVNPDDVRYEGLVGKALSLPLTARTIPLIADSYALMEFGTGAVKVTPAHDPNDYEAGLRNNLPLIEVIGPDAKMNENAGIYQGLDRFEARTRVLADLETGGFLVKTEARPKTVGRCERCGTIVEPLLSEQWFCKMAGTPLVDKAIAAAENGDISFIPARYGDLFVRWLQNIRDWPISRQLWWGHRMPVWETPDGTFIVARTRESAEQKAGTNTITQIDDVLDTWFSSALWPFATLGWPQENADLDYYYPTSALFTAQEILYLWVVRMVMMGEEFINEKPFGDVYIHATILDEHGRRMSKSKGNGVDPVELINLYGADALRYTLMSRAGLVQDIRIKPIKNGKQEQVELARNFANKIWNASRFVLLNLENYVPPQGDPIPQTLPDKWILSRLDKTANAVNAAFESYQMDDAARALYEFFWDDFCDWYIEAAKPRLAEPEGGNDPRHVLWFTLERVLRLLHPIMPYLTEAIWQTLPGAKALAQTEFLTLAAFPHGLGMRDENAEAQWEIVQEITRTLRTMQAENNLPKGGPAFFAARDRETEQIARANAPIIEFLTRFAPLTFTDASETNTETLTVPTRYGDARLPRPHVSAADLAQEKARIEREVAKLQKDLDGLMGRLNNAQFIASAPDAVVSKARTQAREIEDKKAKLAARLEEINSTDGAGA